MEEKEMTSFLLKIHTISPLISTIPCKNQLQLQVKMERMKVLDKETKEAIKKTYRSMDENGDGRVSIAEVKRASKRLGIQFSTEQLKQTMGQIDENDDGYLDYKEFENMIADYIAQQTKEINAARAIYQSMDVDRDGQVTISEIMNALKISKKEAKELLREADTNKDGKMSFEEFLAVFQKSIE